VRRRRERTAPRLGSSLVTRSKAEHATTRSSAAGGGGRIEARDRSADSLRQCLWHPSAGDRRPWAQRVVDDEGAGPNTLSVGRTEQRPRRTTPGGWPEPRRHVRVSISRPHVTSNAAARPPRVVSAIVTVERGGRPTPSHVAPAIARPKRKYLLAVGTTGRRRRRRAPRRRSCRRPPGGRGRGPPQVELVVRDERQRAVASDEGGRAALSRSASDATVLGNHGESG